MSVRIFVCQCAAAFFGAAAESAFSKAAVVQSRVPPFVLCGGMCPFHVSCTCKCDACWNTNWPPLFGLGQRVWHTCKATICATAIPFGAALELPGGKEACGIFENGDHGVPFSFGVV
uniref:Secreted protein n=1 Tax=Rhipicephalus pulchellus TaxID=72859 RepID=L7LV07_RHIPC